MKFLMFIFVVFFLYSCNESEIQGYRLKKNGIYFKLIALGETNTPIDTGSYVTFHIQYAIPTDSPFFDAIRTVRIDKPQYPGSIEECFLMLCEGDSASFFINADNFFNKTLGSSLPDFFPNNSYLKINLRIFSVRTEKEYQKEKAEFLAWIEDFGDYEKTVLKHYLSQRNISYSPFDTVIYKIPEIKGSDKTVNYGDTVVIHFDGYFLNGKRFDSTRRRNEPFSFVYGTRWQVIKGLENAIGQMHEGEKSIFIIPSFMAFGNVGSSTGIIPPYTSVIFEVELLHIGKKS